MGVGRNSRFECLGRRFRITDPDDAPGESTPPESSLVPPAQEVPLATETKVSYVSPAASPPDVGPNAETPPRESPEMRIDVVALSPDEAGCTLASHGKAVASGPPWGLLVLGLFGLLAALSGRRRDSVRP